MLVSLVKQFPRLCLPKKLSYAKSLGVVNVVHF